MMTGTISAREAAGTKDMTIQKHPHSTREANPAMPASLPRLCKTRSFPIMLSKMFSSTSAEHSVTKASAQNNESCIAACMMGLNNANQWRLANDLGYANRTHCHPMKAAPQV